MLLTEKRTPTAGCCGPKLMVKLRILDSSSSCTSVRKERDVCKRGVQKKNRRANYKQCRSILINVNIKHKSRTTKCCVWLFMNSSDGSCIGSSLLSCDGHEANICTSDRNCWFGKGELWSHSSKSTRKYSSERHLKIIRQANILVEMQRWKAKNCSV